MNIQSEIFVSDIHFPYEDKLAWPLTLKVIRAFAPDMVYVGGDAYDFYPVSDHERVPARRYGDALQQELDYGRGQFGLIRQANPNGRIRFKLGNHEGRLERYLNTKAAELAGIRALQFPGLFDLEDFNVEVIGNRHKDRIGKLWHLHGNETRLNSGTVNIAFSMYKKFVANIIFGHWHRLQRHSQPRFGTLPHTAIANPCLCDLNVEYDGMPQWQQGFTLIQYSKSGFFQAEQIQILRNARRAWCLVQGQEFEYTSTERARDMGRKLPRAA